MKSSLALCLLLLVLTNLNAQEKRSNITELIFAIEKVDFPEFSFQIDSVVDRRAQRTDTISVWEYPKKLEIYSFKNGFQQDLGVYIANSFEFSNDESFDVAINQLVIYPKNQMKGMTFLDISFLKRIVNSSGGINYEEVFRIGTWEDREGVDKRDTHRLLIKSVIHKALSLFNLFRESGSRIINVSEIQPIHDFTPREGFFFNRQDFMNNLPLFKSDVEIRTIKKRKKDTQLYSIVPDDSTLYKTSIGGLVWAYSDGKDVYFSTRGYQNTIAFTKMEFIGDGYFIFHHEKVPAEAGLVAGSMGAGVLVGLLTGFVAVPYFNSYQGLVIYDLNNNRIFPGSYESLRMEAKKHPDFFKELKATDTNEIKRNLMDWWKRYMELMK